VCFSAPKSVTLAWAFAPTEAERATILQAHRDVVEASLRYMAKDLGGARHGDGARAAARPSVSSGEPRALPAEAVTELHTLRPMRGPSKHAIRSEGRVDNRGLS
jgi:hypothetical protein